MLADNSDQAYSMYLAHLTLQTVTSLYCPMSQLLHKFMNLHFLPRPVLRGRRAVGGLKIWFYSTSVQNVMYTKSVQHYNWAKQSVCTSNDKILYMSTQTCLLFDCTLVYSHTTDTIKVCILQVSTKA